jgi:glycolate oxidase iron-sulfur subunit
MVPFLPTAAFDFCFVRKRLLLQELKSPAFKALLNKCIHCGMCQQACPTYAVFGTEMDSPRGRITLMRAVSEGRLGLEDFQGVFAEHMERCLACRACESACPSGVEYGNLIGQVRVSIESLRAPSTRERFVRWLSFRQLMPHLGRLKVMARLLWLYQATGLERLFRSWRSMPKALSAMQTILPPISLHYADYGALAPAVGVKRGEVAFFIGCIQEALLSPVNQATVRVLQKNGYEVHFPAGQTCCGAAQLHMGEQELARELARKNIDAFLFREYDAIISNAGGCGATLKEAYADLLKEDPRYAARARLFSARVKDISEFLADHMHILPAGNVRVTATYADSCHLRHGQKVVKQPRELLKKIPGLALVELKQPDRCCGSAGVYNIVQSETANAVLDMKIADIAATGAELVITSNTGCHMQLIAGVRRAGLNARVVHIAEVLDMSYRSEGRVDEAT